MSTWGYCEVSLMEFVPSTDVEGFSIHHQSSGGGDGGGGGGGGGTRRYVIVVVGPIRFFMGHVDGIDEEFVFFWLFFGRFGLRQFVDLRISSDGIVAEIMNIITTTSNTIDNTVSTTSSSTSTSGGRGGGWGFSGEVVSLHIHPLHCPSFL